VANVLTSPTGVTQSGILAENPEMTVINQIPVPTSSGNCHQTGPASGYNALVTVDWFGNPIPAVDANIGAVQAGYNLSFDPVLAMINNSGVNT